MTPIKTVCLHDRVALDAFFRPNTFLNVYSLGDLDDSFWPHTTWYGLVDGATIHAVASMFCGLTLPTLLCMGAESEVPHQRQLLRSLLPLLPGRFYCHLSCGLGDILKERYAMDSHGLHHKMALMSSERLPQQDNPQVVVLSRADLPEVTAFYAESYPGKWFEPQMLDTNQYYGLRATGRLVSVAGVHVYSPTYRVAALGNIATHPAHRSRGYGREVTGHLCRRLLASVNHIGLNVKAGNVAAITCYRALGFEVVGAYEEFMAEARNPTA
jgi:ribosomal protein S18 acetylase RimI-like enzyme